MSFIIDVCVVCVLCYFIFSGYKNGIVKSILGIVSSVISIFISSKLAPLISKSIYDNFIYHSLYGKFDSVVTNSINNNIKLFPSEITNILPKFVLNGLDDYGITDNKIQSIINTSSQSVTQNLMDVFEPVFISFIRPIVVGVLFIILSAIFSVIVKTINKAFKLPILSQANAIFGAILGFVKFLAILFLVGFVLRLSRPFINNSNSFISEDVIDDTIILSRVYRNSYYDKLFSVVDGYKKINF